MKKLAFARQTGKNLWKKFEQHDLITLVRDLGPEVVTPSLLAAFVPCQSPALVESICWGDGLWVALGRAIDT